MKYLKTSKFQNYIDADYLSTTCAATKHFTTYSFLTKCNAFTFGISTFVSYLKYPIYLGKSELLADYLFDPDDYFLMVAFNP